jgi:hypothetical protein
MEMHFRKLQQKIEEINLIRNIISTPLFSFLSFSVLQLLMAGEVLKVRSMGKTSMCDELLTHNYLSSYIYKPKFRRMLLKRNYDQTNDLAQPIYN